MGNVKLVDTEAMRQASAALGNYIENVNSYLAQMSDAAQDCSDNMGSDVLSRKNVLRLEEYIKEMRKALVGAEEVQERIQKHIDEIENEFGDV